MVAQVFFLLLVVAAEYTIVLGYFGDRNNRYFGDRIGDCRRDCDEICSQPCVARDNDDDDWIMTHIRKNGPDDYWIPEAFPKSDICVAKYCSNSCTKKCVSRNSKQETPDSWSWSWSSNPRNNDVCIDNCNKDCGETCTKKCVTRVIGRLGELLLYRDDKCVEKCNKDCSSSCTQKCVTRNNNIELPDWLTYFRNNSRQGEETFPGFHFGEDDRNDRDANYHIRNSTRQQSRGNDAVCVKNCNKDCDESCRQQCVTRGSNVIYGSFGSRNRRNDACIEKCSEECYDSCSQQCVSRRDNRKRGCHFHDWCD